MKNFLSVLFAAVLPFASTAQTNSLEQPIATNAPAAGRLLKIISDGELQGDLKSNRFIWRTNVRVYDQQGQLFCDLLTAFELPRTTDTKLRNGIADGIQKPVRIDWWNSKGETNHALTDQAVYTYSVTNGVTNDFVFLIGKTSTNTVIWNSQITNYGEKFTWNRMDGTFSMTTPDTTFVHKGTNDTDLFGAPEKPKTNSPPAKSGATRK